MAENYIPLDSGVENQFAKDCESSEQIEFYFKLPYWFEIKTPIGRYRPDWAVVFKGEKKIYFVAETDASIYLIEIKKESDIDDSEVQEKATAAKIYCKYASEYNAQNSGKPWKYVLIPHNSVMVNMSFAHYKLMQSS